jgi:hypothetical protein
MRLIFLSFLLLLLGCTAESRSPKASFTIKSSTDGAEKARRLLHEFAMNNNLSFKDGSHTYPSGMETTIAVAERVDGLEFILVGNSKTSHITLATHCHEKCGSWEKLHKSLKESFEKNGMF